MDEGTQKVVVGSAFGSFTLILKHILSSFGTERAIREKMLTSLIEIKMRLESIDEKLAEARDDIKALSKQSHAFDKEISRLRSVTGMKRADSQDGLGTK